MAQSSAFILKTDAERPVFVNSKIANTIITSTDLGLPTAAVSWLTPTVTDNSGHYTITSSHVPGDDFAIGNTTVTYNVVDASGNTASYLINIVVKGNI